MKTILRYIALLTMIGACYLNSEAQSYIQHQIHFDAEDFNIHLNNGTVTSVTSDKYLLYHGDRNGMINLPFVQVDVVIPEGKTVDSHTESIIRSTIGENVLPGKVRIIQSNQDGSQSYLPLGETTDEMEQVVFTTTSASDSQRKAHFLISPFYWNPASKNLEINNSISLTINLKPVKSKTRLRVPNHAAGVQKLKELFPSLKSSSQEYKPFYAIFTTDKLYPAFRRLSDWKCSKGTPSTAFPISMLPEWEGITDSIQKLKYTINVLADEFNCKYVLLGGDEKEVPVVYCYGQISNDNVLLDSTLRIPTDIYFSSPDDLDWDRNKNGIIGEKEDGISLTQSVAIGRVPVDNLENANAFVSKIIDFESHADRYWNARILQAAQQRTLVNTCVDVRKESRYINKNFIAPYWSGSTDELFSSMEESNLFNYSFSKSNFKTLLSSGYSFVDFNGGNGSNQFWMCDDDFYTFLDARNQEASSYSIITNTGRQNGFTNIGHALSEEFLAGNNNGVLAFWGPCVFSNHSAVIDSLNSLTAHTAFIESFYKVLFSSGKKSLAIGDVIKRLKENYINVHIIDTYRWLLFSANLSGDTEMPVYTSSPQLFENISIALSSDSLEITNYDTNCDMAIAEYYISDDLANGSLQVHKQQSNIRQIAFGNIPSKGIISISREGYVPLVIPYENGKLYLQDCSFKGSNRFSADTIYVGPEVTDMKNKGDLYFNQAAVTLEAKTVRIDPGVKIGLGNSLKTISR